MASNEKCGRAGLSTIMDERIRMECENQEGFLRREATTVKLKVMAEAKLDQAFQRKNKGGIGYAAGQH